ncbi:MAG: alpha/beta hydrolase [Bacteroidales bacterium]|jgi:pimeloyl-ACP methyl ester carboxylesterase|nr:alpha/beta hydrolase [Bacteroidales bacterium]
MITEKKCKCLDVTINYIDEGEGVAMVFIHNGGGFLQTWTRQIEYFSSWYRVIALDLPGFGESTESTSSYSLDYYFQVLEVFLTTIKVEKMIIVGNCIGATLAIKYKNHSPHKVIKLVLINICPGERLIPSGLFRIFLFRIKSNLFKAGMKRIIRLIFTKTPLRNRFPDILFGQHPDKLSPVYKKYLLKFKDPRQTRSRINLLFASDTYTLSRVLENNSYITDSLLIWGGCNKVADLKREGYYHRDICGIKTINIIEGSGHLLMYESPARTNKLIREYIES